MDFVSRNGTTAKSKWTGENFQRLKQEFLEEIQAIITMEEIPPNLVMNWDQTGVKIVPLSSWTMEKCGARQVEIAGVDDMHQKAAAFCGTMLGEFLPPQLIYCGKNTRCHPNFTFPSDWDVAHAPKHWSEP